MRGTDEDGNEIGWNKSDQVIIIKFRHDEERTFLNKVLNAIKVCGELGTNGQILIEVDGDGIFNPTIEGLDLIDMEDELCQAMEDGHPLEIQ